MTDEDDVLVFAPVIVEYAVHSAAVPPVILQVSDDIVVVPSIDVVEANANSLVPSVIVITFAMLVTRNAANRTRMVCLPVHRVRTH